MASKQPALYIIMRDDMASMNPGKAMAQASHASNAFIKKVNEYNPTSAAGKDTLHLAEVWQNQTKQGFGTVLVLSAKNNHMLEAIKQASKFETMISEEILDPTYPLQDGLSLHLFPVVTCGYIFGDRSGATLQSIIQHLPLHF